MVFRNGSGFFAASIFVSAALLLGCDKPSDLVTEHLRQGDAALAEGHYARALSAYGHAHELDPRDARIQRATMRARVHLMAASPALVGPDALEDVAYEASWLLESEPAQTAVCLTALANVMVRRGDIEGAKTKLAEAIKADARSYVAHTALGALYMNENGGLGTAKIEFEIALQHKPDAIGALVGLGQVKLAEGDIAGAIDKLEAATRRGDEATAHLALGTARLRQGNHAEAARELRRVLLTDPRNVDALSGLGQALLGTGQLEEAEATLRSAMQIRQDQATAIALGFTLTRLDKPDQALSVFHGVLVANGNIVPALYGSGLANERLGRNDEALANYRRVVAASAEGPQKDVVLELQKESRVRIDALIAAPVGSPSAGHPPTRPNETRPSPRP
jgi:Tfp pilus assembly protein PilF